MLSTAGAVAAIAVMAIITFLTRALPFLLFDRGESPPKLVLYLGRVLPPAIIAMLIVYCLRGVSFAAPGGWVPQLVSVAAVVILHLWRSNTLLSIFGGTILYMAACPGRVSLTQAPAPKRGRALLPGSAGAQAHHPFAVGVPLAGKAEAEGLVQRRSRPVASTTLR